MRKTLLIVGVGLIVVAGLASHSTAAIVGRTTLTGHVPAVVSTLTSTGPLYPTTSLHMAIGLPVRNQVALDLLLSQITDPTSANYRHYLTPEQFTEQFGPTTNDYQAVINFANASGLTVTTIHPNRMIVDVSGTVSAIQTAFQVSLKNYQHPSESRTFYAPDTEPTVSSSLPVLHISGLDNYSIPHPKIIQGSQNLNSGVSPKLGSAPGGAYMGTDFRKTYVPGSPLTGAGQNIGLVQFDAFFASDIAAYASLIGLTNPPNLIVVPIDGGVSVPSFGNGEVCLDIEMIFAMAPGVSNIYVYEAPNPSPWVDVLSRMANDNLARQLSCSWGGGPPDAIAEQIFKQMALQGQSFYNASGDTDAFVDRVNPITFPSDSPNITQVGGTVLTTGSDAVFASETAWNDRFPRPPGYQGTSGGISTFYAIPNWQQGISMANNHGSTTFRNVPDVALTALDVWVISDNGQAYSSGGTSAAAPLWAAFTALVNQQAAISGRPPVGFVNPALYALAKSINYTNVFNDVTTGDNTWPGSPTNFFAVPGYDLCTGLGTPKGTNLINALLATNSSAPVVIISAPRPPYSTTLSVMNGSNPNGPWFLFVQDDSPINTGVISNGWFINLTTANPVGFAADNQLFVTPSSLSVGPNSLWTVSLSVTNYGPSSSTNVVVTDTLPIPGVTLISTNATTGSISLTSAALTWNVGNLPINTGAKLTLNFLTTSVGTYTNDARVDAGTSDPNPDDDGGLATLLVSNTGNAPTLTPIFNPVTHAFQLTVTGLTGQSVIVQASTNLVTGPWIPVLTNAIPFTYTSFDSTNFPARFYRTLVGP